MYKIKDVFLKLATNEWSDKIFLLTSKLCPLGAVCPCPGATYMYRIMKKKCLKSDFKEIFLKLAANNLSDKMFLLTSRFRSQEVVSPWPGAIYMYKIMKKCIKSDFKKIFLKLATNNWSDKRFLLTSRLRSQGVVSPWPGTIYMYKIMKKCIKSDYKEFFFFFFFFFNL